MDGYRISEVATRTGLTSSALRFYEQHGLVTPARTSSGYRSYDERDVEVLRFITRAKGFGLTLEEITDVIPLLAEEACAPVQDRLRDLVTTKIDDAQVRVAELIEFTAELQRISAVLSRHTPAGPCDDTCGCTSEPQDTVPEALAVALSTKPTTSADGPAIACTLAPDQGRTRVDDWTRVLASVDGREDIEGGVRLRFSEGVDCASVAALASAEQDCCRFFTFHLTIGPEGVGLDVTGPPAARSVIDALVGTAA